MFQRSKQGFTLIELMLAMSFVSILLVSIAMLTIQISNLYTQGLTMKEINQAGTEVSTEIKRTMAQAYVSGIKSRQDSEGRQVLCTGEYSYIANNPTDLEDEDLPTPPLTLLKIPGTTSNVRLAKVRDSGGVLCSPTQVLSSSLLSDAVELLGGGDRRLVVSELQLLPDQATINASPELKANFDDNRMLYTVNMILRTGAEDELLDGQCRPPADTSSNTQYCAINNFNIVVRVGNGIGGN